MGSDVNTGENVGIEKRLDQIEQKLDGIVSGSVAFQIPDSRFHPTHSSGDEIDLRELWDVIWRGKWIVIATTLVFAVVAVLYALSLPNIYKSEALLAPADENSGGGLAGLAGQFGGLASLAGVNLGGGGSDKTALSIEVLKSRRFIGKFIDTRELLVPLMAATGWDGESLILDPDIYEEKQGIWARSVKPPRQAKPSAQEAYRGFMEIVNVSQDKTSNFVSISLEFYSPSLAKKWVDWLVADINKEIKERDVAEAKKSIRYLTGQLEKTPIADMQAIFYELIEEQSKTVMFAEVRDEYVFKTIDEAISPELKAKPKRSLICILGVMLGGMLGTLFVLVRHFIRSSKP